MKERPILFSGEMVRAILDGRKTQTRRVVKPQPEYTPDDCWAFRFPDRKEFYTPTVSEYAYWQMREIVKRCPYGQPGDRLWVRESVRITRKGDDDGAPLAEPAVWYMADGRCPDTEAYPFIRPSIHMPRWASRITLEVTDVRVERLQDISEEDAKAEGVKCLPRHANDIKREPPREAFNRLWDEINGKKHPWASNPWVWVVEFRRAA